MISQQLRTIGQGLVLIAGVLGVIAVGLWFRPNAVEPEAHGRVILAEAAPEGIPDSGRQREIMIQQLQTLNDRLAAIEEGLKEGRFQVQVLEPESRAKEEVKETPR